MEPSSPPSPAARKGPRLSTVRIVGLLVASMMVGFLAVFLAVDKSPERRVQEARIATAREAYEEQNFRLLEAQDGMRRTEKRLDTLTAQNEEIRISTAKRWNEHTGDGSPPDCNGVAFQFQSDWGTGDISVTGIDCKTARDLVFNGLGDKKKFDSEFDCTSTAVDNPMGMAYAEYNCQSETASLEWRAY